MEAAFLFNSDLKEFGGFYGYPIQKLVLEAGVLQGANRHMRISVGDLLLMDTLRGGTSPRVIFDKIFNVEPSYLKKNELENLIDKVTIYVLLVQNITEDIAKELKDNLWKHPAFLGCHKVDFTYKLHYEFYYRSLPEKFRIYGNKISILEPVGVTEPERDEVLALELRNLGFSEVDFNDVGGRGTIFDQYDGIEHFKRRKLFEKIISPRLPGGNDEASNLSSFLDEIHPSLFENLASAVRIIEEADTFEDVAQVSTSGRRFLSKISDTLFPPTDKLRGKRKLDASAYRNRLWAYIEDSLNVTGNFDQEEFERLGKEVDRLDKLFNKGLHKECSRNEIFQALVDLSVLISKIININPKLTRRPYAILTNEVVEMIMNGK